MEVAVARVEDVGDQEPMSLRDHVDAVIDLVKGIMQLFLCRFDDQFRIATVGRTVYPLKCRLKFDQRLSKFQFPPFGR